MGDYQLLGCGLGSCGFIAQPHAVTPLEAVPVALPCVTMRELPSPMPTMQPAEVKPVALPPAPGAATHEAGLLNSGVELLVVS